MLKNILSFPKGLIFSCLLIGLNRSVNAQIIPDASLGQNNSRMTPNTLVNGVNADLINGGAIRGINLFHSFREFNIGEGQSVYFANPSGVENILTRVTGANVSNILGRLGVNGNANLVLINPNGLFFGENARLDVGGSFVGTTANAVKFQDRGLFSATNPQAPPLLTVNPSALLFNQINRNAVIENNSIALAGIDPSGFDVLGLRVPDGKSLLLVGSNVTMDGGQLNAFGGRVELAGLAETGTVGLDIDGNSFELGFAENVSLADISLKNQARIFVQAAGGGDIVMNARNLEILGGSSLVAGIGQGLGTQGTVAGNIELNATGDINVADSGSIILNSVGSGAVGQGGDININAATLSLTDGGQLITFVNPALDTQPAAKGDAGNIGVNVTGLVEIAGIGNGFPSGMFTRIATGAEGNGGNIEVNADSFGLRDSAQLSASTFGQGNAGNVTISSKNAVTLVDGRIFSTVEAGGVGLGGNINLQGATLSLTDAAQLLTSTRRASNNQPAGKGDAGNVNLKFSGEISITGSKDGFSSGIFSQMGTGTEGNGGNITIESDSFRLQDDAEVSSSTFGKGNAGNIRVLTRLFTGSNGANLSANTTNIGDGGNIYVEARDHLSFSSSGEKSSGIFSDAGFSGKGNGGDIVISAGSIDVTDGAEFSSSNSGTGNAGNISITASDRIRFVGTNLDDDASGVFSNIGIIGEGNAGDINIFAGSLELWDGAQISSENESLIRPGNSGNITIDARDRVYFDGVSAEGTRGGIFSSVRFFGEGNAGDISVNTNIFDLKNGAQIISENTGTGNAGNVTIKAGSRVSFDGRSSGGRRSGVFSNVGILLGEGKGGDINISTPVLEVTNGAIINSATRGKGDAGNIIIEASDRIFLSRRDTDDQSSGIFSSVDSPAEGNGGNISISTGNFKAINGAAISSSTLGKGNAGNISIEVRDTSTFDGTNPNGWLSGVFSNVNNDAEGKGGEIRISTGSLELKNGAQFVVATFRDAKGDAGNIIVNARDTIDIDGTTPVNGRSSGMFSTTANPSQAGNIEINTGTLRLSRGAVLNSSTSSSGNSGNIILNAQKIDVSEGAQVLAISEGEGLAGDININLKDEITIAGIDPGFEARLEEFTTRVAPISQNSGIFVRSQSTGASGDININASRLNIADRGTIDAASRAVDGGNININSNILLLRDRASISATAGLDRGAGDGGNIDIDSQFIIAIPKQDNDIAANAFQGKGGNIDIITQGIFGIQPASAPIPGENEITASSNLGVPGTVAIKQPDIDPTQGIIELPTQIVDKSDQIGKICPRNVEAARNIGEFIITGRGNLPASPLETLTGSNYIPNLATFDWDVQTSAPVNQQIHEDRQKQHHRIVEAQGWLKTPDGKIELVAKAPSSHFSGKTHPSSCPS